MIIETPNAVVRSGLEEEPDVAREARELQRTLARLELSEKAQEDKELEQKLERARFIARPLSEIIVGSSKKRTHWKPPYTSPRLRPSVYKAGSYQRGDVRIIPAWNPKAEELQTAQASDREQSTTTDQQDKKRAEGQAPVPEPSFAEQIKTKFKDHGESYLRAWMSKGEGWEEVAKRHLQRIEELEKEHPGSVAAFTYDFGIKNFGDYPPELLKHQFETELDREKPNGIILYPTHPKDDEKSRITQQQFLELYQKFVTNYNLKIIEIENAGSAFALIAKLIEMYGVESAAFIIISGSDKTEGGRPQIVFGDENNTVIDPRWFQQKGRFLYKPKAACILTDIPEQTVLGEKFKRIRFFSSKGKGLGDTTRMKYFVDSWKKVETTLKPER